MSAEVWYCGDVDAVGFLGPDGDELSAEERVDLITVERLDPEGLPQQVALHKRQLDVSGVEQSVPLC